MLAKGKAWLVIAEGECLGLKTNVLINETNNNSLMLSEQLHVHAYMRIRCWSTMYTHSGTCTYIL